MKIKLAILTVVFLSGFFLSRYILDVQGIYELGYQDGINAEKKAEVFIQNSAYQKGWEDHFQLTCRMKAKKENKIARR